MPPRLIVVLVAFSVSAWLAAQPALGAEASPRRARMAFTSLSSVMCPPWIAREAGIFNKHGLEVEVIATPTGVRYMMAQTEAIARAKRDKNFAL
ncbi:MAG TPA: hypothetical protein VJQ55_02545, partial [Candidatus Binatia bacterium]|nr:hypothetical protein [Candidatus Binatia bacterium]